MPMPTTDADADDRCRRPMPTTDADADADADDRCRRPMPMPMPMPMPSPMTVAATDGPWTTAMTFDGSEDAMTIASTGVITSCLFTHRLTFFDVVTLGLTVFSAHSNAPRRSEPRSSTRRDVVRAARRDERESHLSTTTSLCVRRAKRIDARPRVVKSERLDGEGACDAARGFEQGE
jgi:hypothetical protein